jgi:hypothetical protein
MLISLGKHDGANPAVKSRLAQLVPQRILNRLPLLLIQRKPPYAIVDLS